MHIVPLEPVKVSSVEEAGLANTFLPSLLMLNFKCSKL